MTKVVQTALKAVAVGGLLFSQSALATPARVQAMESHQMVEDDTDLFLYPSLTAVYSRQVTFHIGTGGVQGGLLHGQEGGWQWGLFHGNRIAYNDLARTSATLGEPVPALGRLVSFFMGKKDGDSTFGFGINPSFTLQRQVPVTPTGGLSSQVAFDLEALVGFGTWGTERHSDTTIALGYHHYVQRVNRETIANTPVLPSIALRHRTFWIGDTVDYGLYGEFARRDESFSQLTPFQSDARMSRWILSGGGGLRFRPVEQVTVNASAELAFNTAGGRVDQARFGATGVAFPIFKASVEASPWEWLRARAGVTQTYLWTFQRPITGGETSDTGNNFSYSVGLGVVKGKWELDATLSTALLLSGPFFVGGNATGLFGGLSARFHY